MGTFVCVHTEGIVDTLDHTAPIMPGTGALSGQVVNLGGSATRKSRASKLVVNLPSALENKA